MPRPRKIQTPEQLAELQEKERCKEATKIKKQCIERIIAKKDLQQAVWPRELSIINKLVLKYPDLTFWATFKTNFSFALPSMAWFLTEKGNDYLAQEYRRATTDLTSLITKHDAPKEAFTNQANQTNQVVEKVEIKKKLLTLKDFLG